MSWTLISAATAAEPAGHAPVVHESVLRDPEVWVAIAFVIVLGLVGRKIAAAITGGLDAHSAKVAAKLEEAKTLRDDAQSLLTDYQRRHKEALSEAEQIIALAKKEAEHLRHVTETDLAETLKRREVQAMERIAQAESQALAEVRAMTVDVAMAAATRLMMEKLPQERAVAMVQTAIANLPQSVH